MFFLRDLAMNEHNPMIYASAIDVNVYVKRKYAPIDDRVRSIISVENQAANVMIAAKTNLADVLPKPYVELAIQIARDSSDFLKKNLVDALAELKDESLRAALMQSNRRAATALTDYAAWLEKEKLPKATPQFAIGRGKISTVSRSDRAGRSRRPPRSLELGLSELKHEQEIFIEAAKKIDPDKSAPKSSSKSRANIRLRRICSPKSRKKLDSIRKYVVDHKLVTIPTEIRAQVQGDSAISARDQFCFDGFTRAHSRNGRRTPICYVTSAGQRLA